MRLLSVLGRIWSVHFFISLTFMTERFGQIFLALGLCRKEFEITQL